MVCLRPYSIGLEWGLPQSALNSCWRFLTCCVPRAVLEQVLGQLPSRVVLRYDLSMNGHGGLHKDSGSARGTGSEGLGLWDLAPALLSSIIVWIFPLLFFLLGKTVSLYVAPALLELAM